MFKRGNSIFVLIIVLLLGIMISKPTFASDVFDLSTPFAAGLAGPFGMAFDQFGNLYVANENSYNELTPSFVSKITPEGAITTFIPNLYGASGLAFDSQGNLFVSDDTSQVYKADPDGNLSVFVFSGLSNPNALAIDQSDNLYVLSAGGYISKYDSSGNVVNSNLANGFYVPQGIVVDDLNGKLYIADAYGTIFEVDQITGASFTWLETGYGTNGGLARDSAGDFYLSSEEVVIHISAEDKSITTCLSGFDHARGLAFDATGNLYITEYNTNKIYRVDHCGYSMPNKPIGWVDLTANFIEGNAIPFAPIKIKIFDPGDLVNPLGVIEFVNDDTSWYWTNDIGLLLQPGMHITITDTNSGLYSSFVITDLRIDPIDYENNIVTGTSDRGDFVYVDVYYNLDTWESIGLQVPVENEIWVADFNGLIELSEDFMYRAISSDNGTIFEKHPPPEPYTHVYTFPHELVEYHFYHFSVGAEITYTLYETQGGTVLDQGTFILDDSGNMKWAPPIAPQPGMYFEAVDSSGNQQSLVFPVLTIGGVDMVNSIMTGTTKPFTEIVVRYFDEIDNRFEQWVDSDKDGIWLADFGAEGVEFSTIGYGGVEVQLLDEENDAFGVWLPEGSVVLPSARIEVSLTHQNIGVYGFTPNNNVTVEIYANQSETDLLFGPTTFSTDEFGEVWLEAHQYGVDLSPGVYIRVINDFTQYTRELELANVYVDSSVDYANGLVYGTTDPNTPVVVWVNEEVVNTTSFENGDWVADFGGPIIPGSIPSACVFDNDGDETSATLHTSNPTVFVVPDGDFIIAADWYPEVELTLIIDDDENLENGVLYTDTQITQPAEGGPILSIAIFDLWQIFDIQPGHIIRVTDGNDEKVLDVVNLTMDYLYADLDVAGGHGPANSEIVFQLLGENELLGTTILIDENGEWFIDLGLEGLDVQLGMEAQVHLNDFDNDAIFAGVAATLFDSDGDGIPDTIDNAPYDYNPDQADSDGDGVGDVADNAPNHPNPGQEDGDGDGVGDVADNAPNDYNPDQADADGDGVGDVADNAPNDYNPDQADSDGDGVGDVADNAPNDYNPDQADTDGDGIGDVADNAPDDYNPDQSDLDGDGVGDVNDPCPANIENTCNPDNSAAVNIGPEGGTLSTPNGNVIMTIPPGALSADTTISITDIGAGFGLGTDLGPAFSVFGVEIGPSGLTFDIPVTIQFSWEDADDDGVVDNLGVIEDELFVSKDGVAYTPSCSIYIYCDTGDNTITFFTFSLSEWVVAVIDSTTLGPITAPIDPVQVNSLVEVTASYESNFSAQAYTAIWSWGDDSQEEGSMTEGMVSGSHVYQAPGVYTITLELENSITGDIQTATYQYIVVYDPDGGFVTGGGWIDSPIGAYLPDPDLTGKATFGFVSRYKKGTIVPTGNTEFQFHIADLNFKSTSYDWLVVTGDESARFKGTGTINGAGEYKFMIWAGDGETDTFRIKIWEEDEFSVEAVIYDNGFDQAIGGGSVVVHTGK